MSSGGGTTTTKNKQSNVQTNAIDPEQLARFNNNYDMANSVANTPFEAFSGEQVAPAKLLANTDLSPYMNPFTHNVIDASIADNERARQMAGVSDAAHATAAGAFGGSRSAVLSSLTNGEYDRNNQSNIAGLNMANYQNAQGAASADNANMQQTQQGIDNANYQEFMRRIGYPIQQQQLRNQALGLVPLQQTVSSNGTSSSAQTVPGQSMIPGLLGMATKLALAPVTGGGSLFASAF